MGQVGDRLRDHRLRHGLSKRALAIEIGVSVPTVMRWEEGTAVPNDYNLYRIERLLTVLQVPVTRERPRIVPIPLFPGP
ncbi:MAG: helix-turn-helix transcriptional regulator [Candidatus Bipolaricaulota bacterium]